MARQSTSRVSSQTWEGVQHLLRQRIKSHWPPGSRLPTVKQLAHDLEAGQGNTHRAVRGLVREGLLLSRPGWGTYVYHPSLLGEQAGRAPSASDPYALAGKTVTILRSSDEGLLDPTIDALRSWLSLQGASVTNAMCEQTELPAAMRQHTDAHALALINNTVCAKPANPQQLVVVVNTALGTWVDRDGRYDQVQIDSEHGGTLAGRWLASIGCENVAFIGVTRRDADSGYEHTSTARLRGFETGYGRSLAPPNLLTQIAYSAAHGARAVKDYLALDPRPEGVFAASDDLAVGFVLGALAHGIEPGRDYQIVGFDGQQRAREMVFGPLTTVAAPMRRMGELAAELLVSRFADPDQPVRRVLVGCSFHEGATARRSDATAASQK